MMGTFHPAALLRNPHNKPDAFEDMLDGWTADQKVEKNDSAIKRYDAFKIDMDSSSQSA